MVRHLELRSASVGSFLLWQTALPKDGKLIDRFVLVTFVELCD